MSDSNSLKEKLLEFTGASKADDKALHSTILFPELAKEIAREPQLTYNLKGLFIITVMKKGVRKEEWFMLFPGGQSPPTISTARPMIPSSSVPVVVVEIDDNDILNFITGGLSGVKAYVSGRVKVVGDLQVALQLEEVFNKTGGVEKAMRFLKEHNITVQPPAPVKGKKAKL
ncbi:hypothetical protein HDU76_012421 [Blyttiomyces sp. JEL0837]|nr:hypothetical protein HDU76_012421 [Blyttiomyces sp. JEL0837]